MFAKEITRKMPIVFWLHHTAKISRSLKILQYSCQKFSIYLLNFINRYCKPDQPVRFKEMQ